MEVSEIAGKLLPLLFNMMGPIALIPAFAGLTASMDAPTRKTVAQRAALLSLAALAIAVFLGAVVLQGWGISKGSLILTAGIIMTLSVLRSMLFAQTKDAGSHAAARQPKDLAVSPLAFPTIVTPQAIAVLIIFIAYFPTLESQLAIFAVAVVIMAINFGAMHAAHWFMAKIGMVPLLVLGAVFGVLQVALGVEMISDGFRELARV
jgi:multiple antibiotic resistance protein